MNAKIALVLFLLLICVPAPALAVDEIDSARSGDRFKLKLNYFFSDLERLQRVPQDFFGDRGDSFKANGTGVAVTFSLSPSVSLGFEGRRSVLGNAVYLAEAFEYRSATEDSASTKYETFASFHMARSGNHRLTAGYSIFDLDRNFLELTPTSGVASRVSDLYHGFSVGGEGTRVFRRFEASYSAKFFPRLSRRQTFRSEQLLVSSWVPTFRNSQNYTSWGVEVRATLTYWFSRHFGFEAGSFYRRLTTAKRNENDSEHGFLVGLSFSR